MKKLLVSACLLGDKVRYDGKGKYTPEVNDLSEHFELVLTCPEFAAIKKAPRYKMELLKGSLINEKDENCTEKVLTEIGNTIRLCKYLGITGAVLKSKSPTCGNQEIYDGTFKGKLVEGQGLLAKALQKESIKVYNETQIHDLLVDYKIIRIKEEVPEESLVPSEPIKDVSSFKDKLKREYSPRPAAREYKSRDDGNKKDFGDRKPRKQFNNSSESSDRPKRPYTPRSTTGNTGYKKDYRPREDGEKKGFGDRKPKRPFDRSAIGRDKPKRDYKPRTEGDNKLKRDFDKSKSYDKKAPRRYDKPKGSYSKKD